ncbi:Mitochondrial fission protein [Kappamyces sp. JEL0680]|nr:Mitochondrial fission protein [Kappamyces sp. JEL0680]
MSQSNSNVPSFLPASSHRNVIRLNSSLAALSWNPWGVASAGEQMDALDAELTKRNSLESSRSLSLGNLTEDEELATAPLTTNLQASPTSTHSTQTWIDQQATLAAVSTEKSAFSEGEMADNDVDEEPITLYQGFRAAHPRMAMKTHRAAAGPDSALPPVLVPEPVLVATPSVAGTSRLSRLPDRARHQAVAINNIATIFTTLLREREKLLVESETLETDRLRREDELRQIEDILTRYTALKKDTMEKINQIIKKEDRVNDLLEDLDTRICSIGDQTVTTEKKIRDIKGNSAVLVDHGETEEPNSCIKTYFGHLESVECVDFETPYGLLVTGSADKSLRIWDLSSHHCLGVLDGHDGWIRSSQLSGYNVVSGSGDKTAKLWDVSQLVPETGSRLVDAQDDHDPLLKTYYGHEGGITCLQFHQGVLVTGSVDRSIRRWDMDTGKTISVLLSPSALENTHLDSILYPGKITNTTFDHVLSTPEQAGWSQDDEQSSSTPTLAPTMHGSHVGGLHFWEHALAAGYGDGVIRLFDMRIGQCHRSFAEHTSTVTTVTFDDYQLLSGSLDKTIKIWDLRMGQVLQSISTSGNVTDLTFDHSRIAVAAGSKSIMMYSRLNGDSCLELTGHSKVVRSVKLSSGRLVSGAMDCTSRLWNLSSVF